jgi:hypothetical protein
MLADLDEEIATRMSQAGVQQVFIGQDRPG